MSHSVSRLPMSGKVLVGYVTIALTTLLTEARGACLKDTRHLRLDKENVAQLNEYLCRSDRNGQPMVRVQFQRLSEQAAGVVLNGGSAPWLNALYGKSHAMSNEVLKEYKNLIMRFGSAVRVREGGEMGVNLQIGTPDKIAKGEGTSASPPKGAEVRSFELSRLPDIPLIDETIRILNEETWPTSLSMYYVSRASDGQYKPLDQMTVWRYLTPQDKTEYSKRLERYNALITDRRSTRRLLPKSIQLLEYLTSGGWPDNFLYSSADISKEEPCLELDFKTNQYSFVVDVAVIQNVSPKVIQIEQLFGRTGGGNQLRQVARSPRPVGNDVLPFESVTVGPGERFIVPLGLTFLYDQELSVVDESRKESQSRFQEITTSPPGTLFRTQVFSPFRGKLRGKNDTYVIRKAKEGFKPPTYPTYSNFAFGPEWALAGLSISGEKILFETASPNFIQLTAGSGVGSCPILYAWDGSERTWIRHGKIIHQADTRDHQRSETVEFDGLADRFRIAEEELERATLDAVDLELELASGLSMRLLPENKVLHAIDGDTLELFANEEVEIVFPLPGDLKPYEVVRSRLTITGYYDRYPTLLRTRYKN